MRRGCVTSAAPSWDFGLALGVARVAARLAHEVLAPQRVLAVPARRGQRERVRREAVRSCIACVVCVEELR